MSDMQATIYDDLHMGDFVAVVVSFTNEKTEHADGGVRLAAWLRSKKQAKFHHEQCALCLPQGLQACTWMTAEEQKGRPHGDAVLVCLSCLMTCKLLTHHHCTPATAMAIAGGCWL